MLILKYHDINQYVNVPISSPSVFYNFYYYFLDSGTNQGSYIVFITMSVLSVYLEQFLCSRSLLLKIFICAFIYLFIF